MAGTVVPRRTHSSAEIAYPGLINTDTSRGRLGCAATPDNPVSRMM